VGKGNLTVNGTLDLNGFIESINGLSGSGIIDNTAATPSTITVGNQGVFSSFSGIITNSGGTLGLTKAGNNVLLLTGNNGHSGGTRINTGTIQMGNDGVLGFGTFTMNDGSISSDGGAARTITNAVSMIAAGTFGSLANTGALTFSGPIDLGTITRNFTVNSEVAFTGGSSNGAMNKFGPGTLTLQGTHTWDGVAEVRNGTMIMDGATVTSVDAFRPDCDIPNGTARLVVGPGSTWIQDAPGGNLRVGSDGNVTATNIADIAGTVRFLNSDAASGKLVLGNGSTIAYANLLTGGRAIVRGVQKNGSGNYCEFNFNGGTLEPFADAADFMQGIPAAYVRSGGANVDTAGFTISIVQDLLDGGGNGGLTKVGAGSLRFNGNNTFTGTTTVNAGSIGGAGTLAGPVVINSGGALTPGNDNVIAMTINNSLVLQGTTVIDIVPEGGPASDLVQGVTTLTFGGTLIVTNVGAASPTSGQVFNLFDATTFSGSFASIELPTLSGGLSWNTNNLAVDGTISVTGSAGGPQFNSPTLVGNTLSFSGSGGAPGAVYHVLTSTDVALPLTNWTAIATNNFDGSGNFNFSDTTSAAQQFYIISVP
jgi:autotransporter-associated beta strand protein